MVERIGDHQRRALEPGAFHQRGEIGLDDEIAIALLPIGRRIAGHRFHVDIVGEQVIAAMGFIHGGLEKEGGEEALADQPPLHVGKGHEHGIDPAGRNIFPKLFKRIHQSGLLPLVSVARAGLGPLTSAFAAGRLQTFREQFRPIGHALT